MAVRQAYQSKHRLSSAHFAGKHMRMGHLCSRGLFFSLESLFNTEGKPEGLARRIWALL